VGLEPGSTSEESCFTSEVPPTYGTQISGPGVWNGRPERKYSGAAPFRPTAAK
jgi:hypothetical protein